MAFIGKVYNHDKDENLKEFLEAVGVPEEKLEIFLNSKPVQKLELDGDEYTLTTNDVTGEHVLKFNSGVEFDEKIVEGIVAKTTLTVEGDVVTQVQKFQDGRSITLRREYTESDLVVIMTASAWDGTSRRFYKAA